MASQTKSYRKYSEIWNHNRGMITKVDHAVNSVRTYSGDSSAGDIKILDVGCGVGTVSLPLAAEGYHVTAVDVDEDSVRFCEIKAREMGISGMSLLTGMLEDVVEPDQSFDWVFLADVLEHIEEAEEFLVTLRSYLKPGGHLWISIPNETTALCMKFNLFKPYVGTKNMIRSVGRSILSAAGVKKKKHVPEEQSPAPVAEVRQPKGDSLVSDFQPMYFNYSLNNDSPHVQEFTHQSIQDALTSSGYDLVSIEGGSLLYKSFPLYHLFDKAVPLSEFDHRLARLTPKLAGNWWVVSRAKAD